MRGRTKPRVVSKASFAPIRERCGATVLDGLDSPGFVTRSAGTHRASGRDQKDEGRRDDVMMNLLWAIAVIFVAMWALGLAFNFTAGGLIHVLLVLAVVSVLFRVIAGRKVLA